MKSLALQKRRQRRKIKIVQVRKKLPDNVGVFCSSCPRKVEQEVMNLNFRRKDSY